MPVTAVPVSDGEGSKPHNKKRVRFASEVKASSRLVVCLLFWLCFSLNLVLFLLTYVIC